MGRYLGQTLSAGAAAAGPVLDLQHDLRALGYLGGGLDGVFGAGTSQALRALSHDLLIPAASGAPVDITSYNRGRVPAITDELTPAFGDCLADMLADPAFAKVPSSADPRADNALALAALRSAPSDIAPTPFLLAIVQQESDSQHYRVPTGQDADNFVVVGLDRNMAYGPDCRAARP